MYSPSIKKLISALKKLPAVGDRTAARYVFHLLKSGKKEVGELTLALKDLMEKVRSCNICFDFSDDSPCAICADKRRDDGIICVAAEPQDVAVIEQTGSHRGRYHILRALLDPSDPESLTDTKIRELLARVKKEPLKEIILALNPDLPGETTMLYLEKTIRKLKPNLKITRLARGLPLGADLRYADEITLSSAIKNRVTK